MNGRLVLYCSLTLFIIVFCFSTFSLVKIATTSLPDFSIFYRSSYDLIHHVSPYQDKTLFTEFNYPLASTVLFIPFITFPLLWAQVVWTTINFLSVFFIVFLCFLLLKKRVSIPLRLLSVSLVLLSFPTKFTFGMGQTNLVALLFLLTGFVFFQKNKSLWSVCFFVIALLLKPILGFTLILFLIDKKWKLFFATSISFLLVIYIVPFVFSQPNANTLFLQNITSQSFVGREVYYNQGFVGFVSRLTDNILLRKIANVASVVFFSFLVFRKVKKISFALQLSLILTLLVIIDPLSWQHHFVFLILPFFSVFFAISNKMKNKILWYSLLAVCYTLVSVNIRIPSLFHSFPFTLILSHQLYGATLLFLLELHLL